MKNWIVAMTVALIAVSLSGCNLAQTPRAQSVIAGDGGSTHVPTVIVTRVISQPVETETKLPADLVAYRDVSIYPKLPGYVEWLNVDRGSLVKQGELIMRLSAPELNAQRNQSTNDARAAHDEREQAESELKSLYEDQKEAESKAKAEEDTYLRLKGAAAYPGVISGNDLEVAQKNAEADAARVRSIVERRSALAKKIRALNNKERAAQSSARSSEDIEGYLRIKAPFNGIITERNVHEGSFVSPPSAGSGNNATPMLRLQQLAVLRLVVPVPESAVAGIVPGALVAFTVPAFTGETFSGTIRRVGHYLDQATRTMPVELDVANASGRLAPGMYAEVIWPVRHPRPALLIPQSAVAKTTERMFVVRIIDGVTQWVDVKTGAGVGDNVEVVGALNEGDLVAVRGTDELRQGIRVETQLASPSK